MHYAPPCTPPCGPLAALSRGTRRHHRRLLALDYSDNFGDGGTTHTFVVELGVGPWQSCALVDTWNTQIVGGSGRSGTVYCTGLEVHPSALLVHACGDLGDITVPFDSLR